MIRRNKIGEFKQVQSNQKVQRDYSLKTMVNHNKLTRNNNEIKQRNIIITKKNDGKLYISLESVLNAVSTTIDIIEQEDCNHLFLELDERNLIRKKETAWDIFQYSLFKELNKEDEESISTRIAKRGRNKIKQLIGGYENNKICSWFDIIREKFKLYINNLTELMVCFFCSLFEIRTLESRHGKAVCFYEMIKAHIKDNIPSLSMFQKSLKWFNGWRKEVVSWINLKAEEAKHRIWEKLKRLIKNELLQLEPQLAI